MSVFEIIMMVCFGVAWPASIYKTFTSKRTNGKSILFLCLIVVGYIAGIIHKLFYNMDNVIYLYILNLLMVNTDIFLFLRNRKLERTTNLNKV